MAASAAENDRIFTLDAVSPHPVFTLDPVSPPTAIFTLDPVSAERAKSPPGEPSGPFLTPSLSNKQQFLL